jgi:hypothetical protein
MKAFASAKSSYRPTLAAISSNKLFLLNREYLNMEIPDPSSSRIDCAYALKPSPDRQLFSNISKGDDDTDEQVSGFCITVPCRVAVETVVLESAD